ncbi:MAG: H-NS family nucleoid-associated regulatory protein [Microvirgula sp.]
MGDSQLQLNFDGPHPAAEAPGPRLGRHALESMDRRAIRRIKANYGQRSGGHFYAIADNGYVLTWGGRGQKPAWIQECLAEGRSLTEIECLLNEVTA